MPTPPSSDAATRGADVALRAAQPADAAALALLFLASSGGTWAATLAQCNGNTPLEPCAARALCDATDGLCIGNTVVAVRAGQVLGGVCAYAEAGGVAPTAEPGTLQAALAPFRALADPQSVLIAELCCAPSARGQGVGGRLIGRVLAHARDLGLPRVSLRVFSENVAAIRLYQRHGFAVTGSRPLVPHAAIAARGSVLRMTHVL